MIGSLILVFWAVAVCNLVFSVTSFQSPLSIRVLSVRVPTSWSLVSQTGQKIIASRQFYLNFAGTSEERRANSLANDQKEQQNWRDAQIIACRPACPSGKSALIRIQVDAATQKEYTIPGQFVQFRSKEGTMDPIFLAMSSAPPCTARGSNNHGEETSFEFLIKLSPRLPWLKEALVEGNTIQLSPVMGKGFPLDDKLHVLLSNNDIDTLLLAAAGSGIAPLKACIESGKLLSVTNKMGKNNCRLYYGEWTEDDLCFTECYQQWHEQMGVTVVPVLSRAATSGQDERNYVQDVIQREERALFASLSIKKTVVLLCGMDDMVEQTRQILTHAGVPEEHILLNL